MSFPLTDPNILGLAYDGMGIMIFGVPAVLLSSATLAQEGGSAWDYNRHTMGALVERKWDTCVGSSFLVAGFTFQIIAAMGYRFVHVAGFALWIALPSLAALYLLIRRRLIQAHTDRVVAVAKAAAEAELAQRHQS